jgi:hypothetical protein
MTGKEFIQHLAQGGGDIVATLLALLNQTQTRYCVIGGLGVNAYADPVVSLDLDLVVVAGSVENLRRIAEAAGMQAEEFEHSLNLNRAGSDLRIQLQKDSRYQAFLSRAVMQNVLGYEMMVASLEDVLQGKIWAYSDLKRRKSKRQKDLADIMRLVETHPALAEKLPPEIAALVD